MGLRHVCVCVYVRAQAERVDTCVCICLCEQTYFFCKQTLKNREFFLEAF